MSSSALSWTFALASSGNLPSRMDRMNSKSHCTRIWQWHPSQTPQFRTSTRLPISMLSKRASTNLTWAWLNRISTCTNAGISQLRQPAKSKKTYPSRLLFARRLRRSRLCLPQRIWPTNSECWALDSQSAAQTLTTTTCFRLISQCRHSNPTSCPRKYQKIPSFF